MGLSVVEGRVDKGIEDELMILWGRFLRPVSEGVRDISCSSSDVCMRESMNNGMKDGQ